MKMEFKRSVVPNADDLKPLQNKLIEILKYFIEFCNRYNLSWWAAYGTLLGAIRHQDIIPWDSDIDIMMPREDYEKLINLSNKLKHPYKLQSFSLTEGYTAYCTHLADINTTFLTVNNISRNPQYELPISIDIFALDTCNSYENMKIILNRIKLLRRPIVKRKFENNYTNLLEYQQEAKNNMLKIFEEYKSDKFAFEVTDELHLDRDENLIALDCYKDSFKAKFRDIFINAPCGYDKILTRNYGDWRTPNKTMTDHLLYFYDTEHPSAYYV